MFVSPGVSEQIDNSLHKSGRKPYKMKRCVLKKKAEAAASMDILLVNFLSVLQ